MILYSFVPSHGMLVHVLSNEVIPALHPGSDEGLCRPKSQPFIKSINDLQNTLTKIIVGEPDLSRMDRCCRAPSIN